jgi:hypothetical protein
MKVEASFGGGFVMRLNGLPQKQASDHSWFYYVNGVLADKGARSYLLRGGEHVWWDYHQWGHGKFIPAVIGAFPQPFINRGRDLESGTVVCAPRALSTNAGKLAQSIKQQGGANVSVELGSCQALEQDEMLVILAGAWSYVSKHRLVEKFYSSAGKTGFRVQFSAEGVPYLEKQNKIDKLGEGASAIFAVGGAYTSRPLWLISGASDRAVAKGMDLLVEQPEMIQRKVGLIVEGEESIHAF